MLAKGNEYLEEATKTVFRMSAEDLVIKRCRDREDYYADIRSYQKEIAKVTAERDAVHLAMVEKEATIVEQGLLIEEQKAEIDKMKKEIERLKEQKQENM